MFQGAEPQRSRWQLAGRSPARATFKTALALALGISCLSACKMGQDQSSAPPIQTSLAQPAGSSADWLPGPPSRYPDAPRIIGIGDVHGDLAAFKAALRVAGVLGDGDRWTGGQTVVVQTGDVLDRGDDEPEILALLARLEEEAAAAGGKLIALNGNHETMNVSGDLRYVTPDGFQDYADTPLDGASEAVMESPPDLRGRAVAFEPGGVVAMDLAKRNVVAIVGDSVFVHGGVLPNYATLGLDAINGQARTWMAGKGAFPPFLTDPNGPVWSRHYSYETDEDDCALLSTALATLKATRMVVGHTVQPDGITQACGGAVWRIDVGLAAHYGGKPEVLEIAGDTVRALTQDGPRAY